MIRAGNEQKNLVVDILAQSFEENGSVNYVVKQGDKRRERIRSLMNYSFNVCDKFGDIWLSYDEKACALVLYPDKKHYTVQSVWWDVNLALSVIGLSRVGKVLKRETKIKAFHPEKPFTYLWYIGVLPKAQHGGVGTQMLEDIIHESWVQQRPVYLETSMERNLPWYRKLGFEIYQTIESGYTLYMLKKEYLRAR